MALNPSGAISLGGPTAGQSIAVELGLSPTATISLNGTDVRTLAQVPS
jgi:chorismate synthase